MELDQAEVGPRRLRVMLAPDEDAPAAARRALRALPLGDREDDVLLLASELVTNAVVHAGLEPDQTIELAAAWDGSVARVEVRDEGTGFRPAESVEGYGLRMVAMAAARWGVEQDGATCVWFELS
jgi:anti-sigma regulatory factor (Ser/Thr protein kinase)